MREVLRFSVDEKRLFAEWDFERAPPSPAGETKKKSRSWIRRAERTDLIAAGLCILYFQRAFTVSAVVF